MIGQNERRTKRRFVVSSGDADEGGSSHPNVASDRELRPRGQKRAAADDIDEESPGSSSDSSDDEIEDAHYWVEHWHGKGPV